MRDQRSAEGHGDVFCPVRATMDLLGQKWSLHIVRELVDGKKRFNQLAHALGGVNSRTLRKRLLSLETEGVIKRRVLSQIPPWVEYELTEKGRTLNEVVDAVAHWGRGWMKKPTRRARRTPTSPASAKSPSARSA